MILISLQLSVSPSQNLSFIVPFPKKVVDQDGVVGQAPYVVSDSLKHVRVFLLNASDEFVPPPHTHLHILRDAGTPLLSNVTFSVVLLKGMTSAA